MDDIASTVTTAITGLGAEYSTVGVAAIGIGVVAYGLKRVWGLAKSLAK